jgi:hypothetical protein
MGGKLNPGNVDIELLGRLRVQNHGRTAPLHVSLPVIVEQIREIITSAESFNAKIKLFRAKQRGVSDRISSQPLQQSIGTSQLKMPGLY